MISVSGNSAGDTSQYTNAQHTQIKGKIVFKYTPFNYWNWIIDNKRSKQQPSHDPQRVHEYPNDNCCNYLILVLFWFIFISFIEKCCRKQKHVNAFKSAPATKFTHNIAWFVQGTGRMKCAYFIHNFFWFWNQWLMRLQKHSALLTFTFSHELADKYRRKEILRFRRMGLESFARSLLCDADKMLKKSC